MKRTQGLHVVAITLVVALMLDLLPWTGFAAWLKPSFTVLVLLYWVLRTPFQVNVGWAFWIGLVLDLINGGLLGEQALALVIVVYLLGRWHPQLRRYSESLRWLAISVLLLLYFIVIYLLQSTIGEAPTSWSYWCAWLVSALIWPIVVWVLHHCSSRFTVI